MPDLALMRFLVAYAFAMALLLPARILTESKHNISIHVVEVVTGKPLSGITVNLRLGDYPGRKTLQHVTDSSGIAYFNLEPPLPHGVSADAFAIRYHETQADAGIDSVPKEVTIPVRRLSFLQSLHSIFAGE